MRRNGRCAHHGNRRDGGFTLVEVSIALVVLSIVLAAFGAFLITAVTAQRANEYRTKATQAGTQVVESMRALPWDLLGFYADDTAASTTCTGGTSVALPVPVPPGTKSSDVPVGGPHTVTVGNVDYEVTTCLYWQDDPTDGIGAADPDGPGDIKKIVVDLAWSNAGSAKHLAVTGTRAPTADEVTPKAGSASTPFGIQGLSASPSSAPIDSGGNTTTPITFTATTTSGVTVVQLKWTDQVGTAQLVNMTPGATTTSWTYTLPAGSGQFPASTRTFTAVAVSATGEQNSQAVQVAFSAAASSLTIPDLTATPNSIDVSSTGFAAAGFTISATASAPVSTMTVTYRSRSGGDVTRTMSVAGATGTVTFDVGTGPYPDGAVDFWVTANSAIGSASRSITMNFVAPTVVPVTITNITVTPQLCLKDTGAAKVLRASTVTVKVTGVTMADRVTLEFNDKNKTQVEATTKAADGGGVAFSYTVGTAWEWTTNELVVTALATRVQDNTQSPVSYADPSPIKYAANEGQC